MSRFELHFDWSPFAKLDQFALQARQDYNLGNDNKWFNCFRGGLFGLKARLKGVEMLYADIHEWGKAFANKPIEIEAILGSLFFNMDSVLECFVFALNSLGYSLDPNGFLDIGNKAKLKQISPYNLIGDKPIPGYAEYFPQTKAFIIEHKKLIKLITASTTFPSIDVLLFKEENPRLTRRLSFLRRLALRKPTKTGFCLLPILKLF
ncbi:MAG: hypothetical protein JSU85_01765 [Candidatus Zixiibacteriota bacterium]|nr:MAG: hypothetical protein JSU85_01765 [candidate division Zixibacteria bacterium]